MAKATGKIPKAKTHNGNRDRSTTIRRAVDPTEFSKTGGGVRSMLLQPHELPTRAAQKNMADTIAREQTKEEKAASAPAKKIIVPKGYTNKMIEKHKQRVQMRRHQLNNCLQTRARVFAERSKAQKADAIATLDKHSQSAAPYSIQEMQQQLYALRVLWVNTGDEGQNHAWTWINQFPKIHTKSLMDLLNMPYMDYFKLEGETDASAVAARNQLLGFLNAVHDDMHNGHYFGHNEAIKSVIERTEVGRTTPDEAQAERPRANSI